MVENSKVHSFVTNSGGQVASSSRSEERQSQEEARETRSERTAEQRPRAGEDTRVDVQRAEALYRSEQTGQTGDDSRIQSREEAESAIGRLKELFLTEPDMALRAQSSNPSPLAALLESSN